MNSRAAIVTTLRDAGATLDSFIGYHLAVGFERLYLFFDDPADPSVEVARRYPQVTAVVGDEALRSRWKETRLYAKNRRMRRYAEREVMARQALNAGLAIEMALRERIEWLLHIDSDELFYSPAASVGEHFAGLTARGVRHVTYPNYEAVPESAEIGDYFREVTLFKKSPWQLPPEKGPGADADAPHHFFYYYEGKSAARLCEGLIPRGVHEFWLPDHQRVGFRLRLLLRRSRVGQLLGRHTGPGRAQARPPRQGHDGPVRGPVILHYPCCGFEHFYRKYLTLGPFPDKWFGKYDISRRVPFHLEARDAVQRGDETAARSFYERRRGISDRGQVERLISEGLLCRITQPSEVLAGMPHRAVLPGRLAERA